jgi:hypothetical protein
LLPLVTPCYPLLPLVTTCYPLLPRYLLTFRFPHRFGSLWIPLDPIIFRLRLPTSGKPDALRGKRPKSNFRMFFPKMARSEMPCRSCL